MTFTSTQYSCPRVNTGLTERKAYTKQQSLAAPFFLVGFLIIACESFFFNPIKRLIPTLGLPVFIWPSEFWFIGVGGLVLLTHLAANQARMRIGDGGPILFMALFLCIVFFHGIVNGNSFVHQEYREVGLGILGLPGILLLAPYFDFSNYVKKAVIPGVILSTIGLFFIFYERILHLSSLEYRITSNAFSLFLLLILPFAFLAYATHRKKYLMLLGIVGLTILANFSKVTLALFLFAIFCSLGMFNYLHPKVRMFHVSKRKIVLLFKVVFIIFAALVALYSIDRLSGGFIQNRINETFLKKRYTSSGDLYYGDRSGGRIAIWKASVSLWREKPLFGHGLGKVTEFYSSGWGKRAGLHNYFFQFLQNTGSVGILLIVTCWIVWLRRILPKVKSVVCIQTKLVLSAMVVFVFVIMFYGLFGHSLSYPPIRNLFWVCIGFLSTIYHREHIIGSGRHV